MSLRVFAPAKVNLTLHVGPPGADGYHALESLVAFADVGDTVELTPADTLSLVIDGPFGDALAGEADNLVLRAARALKAASRVSAGAAIRLTKMLPIAAGLGGGTADAAAALRGLSRLWRLDNDVSRLAGIAAAIGADGAVCLASRAAVMTGRGEVVAPVDLPTLHAVLVNPGAPSPTAAVYRRFDARGVFSAPAPEPTRLAAAFSALGSMDALVEALAARRNDLEAAAIDLAPDIAAALAWLREFPTVQMARLSGSGATCFALVPTAEDAAQIAAAAPEGWWVKAARLEDGQETRRDGAGAGFLISERDHGA